MTPIATAVRSMHHQMLFRGDTLSRVAAVVLLALVAFGLVGPWLPLGDAEAIGVGPRLASPAPTWPAGTDDLGRSVLPRLVEGLRVTLLLSTGSALMTMVIGTVLGMVAACRGGVLDEVVARIADVLFAFPAILLAILVTAVVGPGAPAAGVAIVLIAVPLMVRVVRVATVVVAERDFVIAASVAGASFGRIVFVHVLPNIAGAVVVQGTYAISVGMLVEGALSFLGLGVQPPDASLGSMLHESVIYLQLAPWLVFIPAVLLSVAIMCVNLVGDGLRDALDPRTARLLR